MGKDQADQNPAVAGVAGAVNAAGAASAAPSGPAPLLRTLGDANAAVCTDGFCELPQPQELAQLPEPAPGFKSDDGSHE